MGNGWCSGVLVGATLLSHEPLGLQWRLGGQDFRFGVNCALGTHPQACFGLGFVVEFTVRNPVDMEGQLEADARRVRLFGQSLCAYAPTCPSSQTSLAVFPLDTRLRGAE